MAKVKFTIEDWHDIKVGQKVIFRHQTYFGVTGGKKVGKVKLLQSEGSRTIPNMECYLKSE